MKIKHYERAIAICKDCDLKLAESGYIVKTENLYKCDLVKENGKPSRKKKDEIRLRCDWCQTNYIFSETTFYKAFI